MDQAYEDITPRTVALVAALHAKVGDKKAAEEWLFELIAWTALESRNRWRLNVATPIALPRPLPMP